MGEFKCGNGIKILSLLNIRSLLIKYFSDVQLDAFMALMPNVGLFSASKSDDFDFWREKII